MRKINTTLLNEKNKEEAILKIKDDSFVVTTSNNLIKISHSDVKSYNYNDNKEILTITKFGGSSISLGIKKDKDLLVQLDNLVNTNKNINDENIDKKLENKSETIEIKQNNNKANTTNNHELSKEQKTQPSNNRTTDTNSSNNGIGGVIVFLIICGVIIWVLSKAGLFRIFNRSPIGTWYNEYGTTLTINKNGTCEVKFSDTDNYIKQFKQYYDWGDVIITKCEWKKDFNEEHRATVSILMKYGTLEFSDELIKNDWVNSNDWGGFKRK